jgi:two-component system sensor histidine kinase RegB
LSEAVAGVTGGSRGTGEQADRKNMRLLIDLRWIAVGGQLLAIGFARYVLGIELPLTPMLFVLGVLVAMNLASLVWLIDHAEVSHRVLLVMLLLDIAALSTQLYLSGGASNPFAFLYLLQVALAPVLLETWANWLVVMAASAGLAGVTLLHRPLVFPVSDSPAQLVGWQLTGLLVCFALEAALLVVFARRMMRNLRQRDAALATLRQHAAEEHHIVRMGLLASGAAHELGTPLSVLSVILNDWKRMEILPPGDEPAQELEEMQMAVQRCKSIVTGILISSGEARGEAPQFTSVRQFTDEVVADWRVAHAAAHLHYTNLFGDDLRIISDAVLKQVIFNLLENAYEASPGWIALEVTREGQVLVLSVCDRGAGFSAAVLEHFGWPYHSSKGRTGGGLGLFLVVNVIRKLGGEVSAANLARGGAQVRVTLPLSSLSTGTAA